LLQPVFLCLIVWNLLPNDVFRCDATMLSLGPDQQGWIVIGGRPMRMCREQGHRPLKRGEQLRADLFKNFVEPAWKYRAQVIEAQTFASDPALGKLMARMADYLVTGPELFLPPGQ
jgi:hypothetical protein